MNLLVTGGAGFIGSHFVDRILAETDHTVTVLDALTYAGHRDNLAQHDGDPRYRFVLGDVADPDAVAGAVAGAGAVVNFAAESFVDRSIADAAPFVRTNVSGTHVLLEACRERSLRLLQVSTDEVYGSTAAGSFTEDSPLRPNSPYAATKAAGDLLCLAYRTTYGTPVTIVRGSNAYGPRQHPEKAIPVFAAAALEGRPLPVYGDGSNRREWLFVTDFASAVLAVLDREGPPVTNIGGGREIANLELARRICALAGAPDSLVTFVPDRPGHDLRYALSWDRLAGLGWRPAVGFDVGLARTVEWFRAHPERRLSAEEAQGAEEAVR